MNSINPKKLLHSKWTAVQPMDKQKHFEVTRVVFDSKGQIRECMITAAYSGATLLIDWRELQSQERWLQGWR
ncbi:TIGR02450 family Trp-rich protein [Pseudohongiella spirulinae]|uniref:TIGR02450 family Trp-rich protein n=1 Tax=Pseudohongiella spirulinae TaxID=1249552 RepID=A0A0S2KC49_9GAMM|nr:TIGR02450 family Trp-rich protein [Pseudohongiella spirulinae]ALO45785.1 hypothetical protein PS2015_1123 [Pseudohongiella spirulinae]